ncbi:MAG: MobF family relaxase, partial [Acidimicrobiales bacterium]
EEQMEALFGHCCDPRDGAQLGRRMASYRSVEERVADRLQGLDHPASEEERATMRDQEVAKGTAQAVSGFDLTFSAPKSISVLFALGGPEMRETIRSCHQAAWREAYGYFESEVAATRLGAGGVAQVDVQGVTAAAFEHWYSRAGDPQLHTHVATSVMVQTEDGRWRRLDSRALYRAAASAGELYTAKLMSEAAERLGLSWRHRASGRSQTLLPEVAGVGNGLIAAFSARSASINDSLATLVASYTERHGYAPSRDVLARLAQQATLSDRPAGAHRVLSDSLAAWAAQAGQVLGCRADEVAARIAHDVGQRRVREHGVPQDPNRSGPLRELRAANLSRQAQSTLFRLEATGA